MPWEKLRLYSIYISEARLPIKVPIHTQWVETFQETLNNQALQEALDLLPMVRGDAYLREETGKAKMIHF